MLQSATSDLGLHCLPLIQHFQTSVSPLLLSFPSSSLFLFFLFSTVLSISFLPFSPRECKCLTRFDILLNHKEKKQVRSYGTTNGHLPTNSHLPLKATLHIHRSAVLLLIYLSTTGTSYKSLLYDFPRVAFIERLLCMVNIVLDWCTCIPGLGDCKRRSEA